MKKKVFLKRFYHRDKLVIGLFFGYDEKLKATVKFINGITYSKSNTCFYLDDNEDNIKLILRSLKDVADVDISAISGFDRVPSMEPVSVSHDDKLPAGNLISLSSDDYEWPPEPVHGKEKDEKEIMPVHRKIKNVINGRQFGAVEFTIRENDGLLVIKFDGKYDPAWIAELKSYGRARFDSRRHEWLLNWTKITCDSLADYFASKGIEVTVTRQVLSDEIKAKRLDSGNDIRGRELGKKAVEAIEKMKDYLEDNRYSVRTSKSYMPLLEILQYN
jgi:hypothetical protein